MTRHAASLTIAALACRRGGRPVFEGLSFEAAPGEAVELRGPNGAGKSSLLRMIAGLLPPAAGQIIVSDPTRPEDEGAAASLLYLGHADAVKGAETVRAQLEVFADLFAAPRAGIAKALSAVGLTALAERAGGSLSAGQRRRLALARLIVADRPVWLLAEPAAPLDAQGRALLGDLLAAHCAQGGLVIAAAHDPLPGVRARVLEIPR
jgi:heme exporter protein A